MEATKETPAETPTVQPPPTDRKRSQLFRRDFLVGGAAGVIAAKASEWLTPPEWNVWWGAPQGAKLSYAQNGEDLVIAGELTGLKIEKPTYLDIGAWEPIESNNTYLLYRKGGRGVLVEPNVDLTSKLKRKRPGDTVLVAGIGLDDNPSMDYYVLSDPQLNTFDKSQMERLTTTTTTKLLRTVKMPMININRVIDEHFGGSAPDVLSIDIEGLDLPILKTLDYAKFRPKMICAETIITATQRHNRETREFLESKNYEIRGMTYANTVFVDRALLG